MIDPNPSHLLAVICELNAESLSLNHPDNTTDCQSLALDHLAAIGRVAALEAELAVTNKLLAERNRVMEAIPECPEHGSQCVPHALEWIERVQKENAILKGYINGDVTWDEVQEVLK
jgi:hypothetical protein